MNKALYNQFIVLLTSRLLQTNNILHEIRIVECYIQKLIGKTYNINHYDYLYEIS
jgi:hypothetical protein